MCNEWCLEFAQLAVPHLSTKVQILEVGSRDVNGSTRKIFLPHSTAYVGVDIYEGVGVDKIVDVKDLIQNFGYESFDVVTSTEMLEHCENWQEALYQMASVLRVGGLLLVTTRSPGFELHDYPADYWRFTTQDFRAIFAPVGDILVLQNDMTLGWPCGIGILLRRTAELNQLDAWHENMKKIPIYSMTDAAKPDYSNEKKIDQIIFDQYSRYQACADLLRQAGFTSSNTVLDIGSGPECLFGQFMPDATATYVDPLLQGDSEQGRIKGDIFSSELDKMTFDCVTSIDVYEHVPPEHRQEFLERMSSLSKSTLILGFPTSDTSDASMTDKIIDDQYRAIFGHNYSWLEEHQKFGLPSLAATVEQLNQIGWHCQTVGHGHAPWLQSLLRFVVCVGDIPSMKKLILTISEKFNRELYPYDFRPPHYRQFVIATRRTCAPIILPKTSSNIEAADEAFRVLMEVAWQQYFTAGLRQLVERDAQIADLNQKVEEVSKWGAAQQTTLVERDAQIADLNQKVEEVSKWGAAQQQKIVALEQALSDKQAELMKMSDWAQGMMVELDQRKFSILSSTIYRARAIVSHGRMSVKRKLAQSFVGDMVRSVRDRSRSPAKRLSLEAIRHYWHVARWIIKNRGLSDYDRVCLKNALRSVYHKMPLPIRKMLRWGRTILVSDPSKAIKRSVLSNTQYQLPAIRPSKQIDGKPDYIVWGVIDWHFRQQRPQHLAQELSASGRRVFYVSVLLVDDERAGFEAEKLDAEGRLFQIKLCANGAPLPYSSAPGVETLKQLRLSIGEVLQWADTSSLVSLVQHPFWYDVATVLPNARVVYDCMDHHEGFGNTAPEILALERALLRSADLCITTSEYLDQIVAEQAKRRALIRNAGEFEHFAHQPASIYRDPQGRKVIGYYGAIAEWFDQDLVESIARRFPNCSVLLVGADTVNAKHRLGQLPNVEFVGEIPYAELPYYLYGFDVCILPFKIIPLTLATNPVKIYEYLSAGKTVVTVDLPEMKQFGDLIHVAGNTGGFLAHISSVLSQPVDQALVNKRQTFAQGQTWRHRIEMLITQVESAVDEPKVSVIVVTYNNVALTKACLASLAEHSDYEQMEIVVVDNASSDGSTEFLSEWVVAGPNRQLILNNDNRGFAAANNQGLAIAKGEYIVLLNNDTYVTPGWVRTLMNHLCRDNNIGLIGPVTNNIGNEAKIDLSYTDMAEMHQAAASYTRQHIGQVLPLRTAAFFCVMMRRDVYQRVGVLDEAFGRGFFEDDDYCRRVEQLGLRIVCAEDVFIHHHLSASFNRLRSEDRQALFEQNKAIYEAKWGQWTPHTFRKDPDPIPTVFNGFEYVAGRCNVCGNETRFFYNDVALWRESLTCEHCLTTSRYRSISRGILWAINQLSGVEAKSLAALPRIKMQRNLRVYDTQPPFYYAPCAYPLPDLLKASGWIDVELSQFKPKRPMGDVLAPGVTNQNLECLTFADSSLDIVITSDVMEHVRLDDYAHREIHRVLRPGGVYIFTVPHNRSWDETLTRVQVTIPDDPSKDIHLLEPEYHGDTNSDDGGGVLAYRTYGRDLEERLTKLGFQVEYFREDILEMGILNTELYYCRKIEG